MRGAERGFLLLTAQLGDPQRKPLTVSQLRILASRMQLRRTPQPDRELTVSDLSALGYGTEMAERIIGLLSGDALLEHYLHCGKMADCQPVTRASADYPRILPERLGQESPGCLWAKGDLSLLEMPKIALVGSRNIASENLNFAREVGIQAARQGYALISGNARGADKAAQNACLESGGAVIAILADSLEDKACCERVLYLSENDFEQPFSAQRAISRNRVIHALADKTFVAQSGFQTGGTWDGTVKNLSHNWSPVFCFADGSIAAAQLQLMGAVPVSTADLADLSKLQGSNISLFDT